MPPSPRGGKEIDDFSQFQGGYCWILCIPQSKIKDFCQPPLGKGAFVPHFETVRQIAIYFQTTENRRYIDKTVYLW